MAKSQSFTASPARRSTAARITSVGWFLVLLGAGLLALVLLGGGKWLLSQLPAAPTATPTPTAPPTGAAPTATPTLTPTAAFPATWAAGMYQDANGQWWPAEDVREQVQQMVEQHYLKCDAIFYSGPLAEILPDISDNTVQQCWGVAMQGAILNLRQQMQQGLYQLDATKAGTVISSRSIAVQNFSQDGLTCQLGDTHLAGQYWVYTPQTQAFETQDIPVDGLINGQQQLGVKIVQMHYDQEDGRWKIEQFVQWIPRP